MKLLQNKRDMQLKHMKKEIAHFLQAGQEPIARIRVEHVIREMNLWAAYEILELFCEFILARVPILESEKECPRELREAIASIIFAAPRCSEVPDLLQIKNLFGTKYGKEFIMVASELRPDSGVNRTIIEKLSPTSPSGAARLKMLKEIAQEYSLNWDSSATEAEFMKSHEDLLGGAKQIHRQDGISESRPSQQGYGQSSVSREVESLPAEATQRFQKLQAQNPVSKSMPSSKLTSAFQAPPDTRRNQTDVMEIARAALASADRATAAARAAAQLVNVSYGATTPTVAAEGKPLNLM
ncbi:Regulator of Vps4 activity in the MVB pathway protein [Arabidopsis thaliana]|jgi:vacuolar protein sorting-associated protein IST1|nr:Regulator of Vps4 activity in the MVB pathway protein [Arabidopsis thaliana]ANM58123.1 Regulator of Vps4 activity in the MVB pathway protein [Arabidopsis thaliana]|eukprot:NP_001320581.1 Regulator of Vps4 activity in the MVB pathway protein [Arabidopsis thaliana]